MRDLTPPVAAVVALLVAVGPAAGQEAPDAIDALFARWSARTPGCAVGVDAPGRPPLRRVYGLAEMEHGVPARVDTIYEAGSVSKQFTAAAVLLLVDDGVLSLDDALSKWIPELPEWADAVTIRRMLDHTAGLRDWGAVAAMEGWPRGTRDSDNADVVRIMSRQTALNFEPGTEWSYSNSGYNLAAVIVERASGRSLAEFTRTRLFDPLGMSRTSWRDDHARVVPGRADAYAPSGSGWRRDMPFEDAYGNGGLLTTVDDLLIWNRALEEDRAFPGLGARLAERGSIGERRTHYGLGLQHDAPGDRPEIGHAGVTAGYRGWAARYPEDGVSVAVLCNAGDADARLLGRAAAARFLPPAPAEGVAAAGDAPLPEGLWVDVRTGQPVTFGRTAAGALTMGGRPLAAAGPDLFAVGDDRLQIVDAGTLFRVTADGDRRRLERREPWAPTTEDLVALEGVYVSDEAAARLEATVRNGRLVLSLNGRGSALAPSHTDVFTGPPGLVRLERDATGRAVALHIDNGRVRDMRFRRLD